MQQLSKNFQVKTGLSSATMQPWASCLHICASINEQYNLVPANGSWCSAAGEVTAGLAEGNGSLPPGLWLRSPASWLPRTGISSKPYTRFEYGTIFTFYCSLQSTLPYHMKQSYRHKKISQWQQ